MMTDIDDIWYYSLLFVSLMAKLIRYWLTYYSIDPVLSLRKFIGGIIEENYHWYLMTPLTDDEMKYYWERGPALIWYLMLANQYSAICGIKYSGILVTVVEVSRYWFRW